MAEDRYSIPEPLRAELVQALQQWSANPQAAATQVRALADRETTPALQALAAVVTAQAGPWQDGLPYARAAADAGVVGPLNSYFGNMLSDPAQQAEAVDFIGLLRDAGWPIDPFSYIVTIAQTTPANIDLINRILSVGTFPAPSGAREQWEQLVEETRAASDEIKTAAGRVTTEQ